MKINENGAPQPLTLLGIVGTGLMGSGIAQIAILGNIPVLLYDNRPSAALEAQKSVTATLQKLVDKGKLSPNEAAAANARLSVADGITELAACSTVIEAIVENLEAKRQLFQELEAIVDPNCPLVTNTSSLSVTSIAALCKRPERVAGLHFFSPVPVMKLVEVVGGARTDGHVLDILTAMAVQMGHTPVRAKDTPGFIVNHCGRGYLTESLRVLGENITQHHEIDCILRQTGGFRMGPFELLDLTGLDVSHPVMETIYEQFYHEPRYRPSTITRQRLTAGLLGRKTSRGFYHYESGRKVDVPEVPVPARVDLPVWLSAGDKAAFPSVVALLETLGVKQDQGERPKTESLCVVLPVGQDATSLAIAAGLDPTRSVGLDPLFLTGRRTVMTTPVTQSAFRDAAHALFAADGTPVSVIRDSAGCIAQRVVAAIVNIGCDIAQQGIATPQDIDLAVTLGLGYPKGPLAMGDALGPSTVIRILDGLFAFYQDPRYRPSPWLKRRALLGMSLLMPES